MIKILSILSISLIVAGCELLSTREPEKPVQPRTSFKPATTIDQLLENLVNAHSEKISDDYFICFADTLYISKEFRFFASSETSLNNPIFEFWGIEKEKQFYSNLISLVRDNSSILVSFTNKQKTQTGDSALVQLAYTISFVLSAAEETSNYSGSSELRLKLDSRNFWVITEWTDYKIRESISWSELKASLY